MLGPARAIKGPAAITPYFCYFDALGRSLFFPHTSVSKSESGYPYSSLAKEVSKLMK